MSAETTRPRLSSILAAVIACSLALGLLVPAPVAAGDNATILYFEPDEVDAESGDTMTIDLVASSHGDYYGEGIDQLSFTIEYDADVLTVTDVEYGPMLGTGDDDADVNGTVEIDDDAGNVTVEQERTPSGDGAKATDTAATLTLEIAEDAPPSSQPLEITDASPVLVSGYPQGTIERDATITIDGGAADNGAESDASDDTDTDADDPVPGFTPLPVLAGIIGALWLRARR